MILFFTLKQIAGKELEKIKYDKAMIVELYRENYSSYDELAVCANNMKKIYDKYKMGL